MRKNHRFSFIQTYLRLSRSFIIFTLPTLYEILGVQNTAGQEELRKAYRKLARKHHPDVSEDPASHEKMSRINEAFETLIDPALRMEYDAMLHGGMLDQDDHMPPHTAATANRRKEPPKPVTVRLAHRLKGHRTPIYGLAFDPDTSQLVSSSFDNEIIWWDIEKCGPQRKHKIDGATISTVRVASGGKLVVAGAMEHLLALSSIENDEVTTWRQNVPDWVSCVAVSADGTKLASGSVHRTVTVSRVADGSTIYSRRDHTESVTALLWSEDNAYLISGAADATVKIWNGSSGALLMTIPAIRSAVTAMALSTDNRYLCVAAVDLSIRVFRLADGQLEKVMFGHHKPIEALAFHPNGWLIASASRDGVIGLWNAAKGLGQTQMGASHLPIGSLAFSPDGHYLAAGGLDKTLRLWSIEAKADTEE
jgi:WD40 repeat protein